MSGLRGIHQLARGHLGAYAECAPFLKAFEGDAQPDLQGAALAVTDASSVAEGITAFRGASALVDALIDGRRDLNWWSAYTDADPAGRGMADRMAATLLCGDGGAFASPDARAGFFFVERDVEYAAHAHRPDEIYAIIAGEGRFWNAQGGWKDSGAGDVVVTPSQSWHAMRTTNGPVFILWAWCGDGLDETPIFRDDSGELPT
ncbi:MAG: dimethylsulfonioproprionate lyase family protein [Pseudomonadota bacterium]